MVEICPDCEEPRCIKKETKPHVCMETLKEKLAEARHKIKELESKKSVRRIAQNHNVDPTNINNANNL